MNLHRDTRAGTPQTGPRRTPQAAQEGRRLPGLQRRYPVLGLPTRVSLALRKS